MEDVRFEVIDPMAADAQAAMAAYFAELDRRFPGGFEHGDALSTAGDTYRPPAGVFVVVRATDDTVLGCGAVQFLDASTGEVKRMWVAERARGTGLGRRLLAHLEGVVAANGCSRVVLDTNGTLSEAIAMYGKAGYHEVPPYNGNPYAEHWFEKPLP